jgi:anti-sigma regulatory factor (Ser/Thr protein kinase)
VDSIEVTLECGRDSASSARTFVARELASWRVPRQTIDDAVLLTSELVTNAVRHCAHTSTLRLMRRGRMVRVEVDDDEQRPPVLQPSVEPDAERGRGLRLVDALSTSWGWQPLGPGKRVWFELPTA